MHVCVCVCVCVYACMRVCMNVFMYRQNYNGLNNIVMRYSVLSYGRLFGKLHKHKIRL